MKKEFNFKLNGLLKLREFKEQKIKNELGAINREIIRVEEKIILLEKYIEEAYTSQNSLIQEKTRGHYLRFYPDYVEAKRAEIKNNKNTLEMLKIKFNEKCDEMNMARGEVKVLENLRENKLEAHKKSLQKKENEVIEEMNIQKRNV